MTLTAEPATTAGMTDAEVAQACRAILNELSNMFIERRPALEVLFNGLLAKQHVFLLGPPGTGKSMLIRELCRRIFGARYARLLLDKELPKDEFQGEIDIAEYEAGNGWIRDYDGTVVDAHLAFLDEVGKAGPAVLNRMLTWMEEREHKPGKTWEDSPTISIIGASNELLDMTEGLGAIWDRFLLRYKVDYIAEPANFGLLLRSKLPQQRGSTATSTSFTTIDLPSLERVINHTVPNILVPDSVIDSLIGLRSTLAGKGIIPSDRRWAASMRVIQASAFLAERDEADADDILPLRHVLWNDEGEVDEVRKSVMALGSPTVRDASLLSDQLNKMALDLASHMADSKRDKMSHGADATAAGNAVEEKLRKAYVTARKAKRSTAPLDDVANELANVRYKILVDYVGVSETSALATSHVDY